MKVSKKLWKLGKSKLATCKIVVRFSNANRLVISTGTTCAPQHWSKTLQCLTDGPNYRQINNQIDQKVLDVINVIKNHPTFTDAQMRKLLDETFLKNKTVAKNKKQSFNQFCRYELAQRTDIALGTLKNHRKILNHFDNITPNCAFREFNTKTIEKINQFCRLNNFTEATTYNFHKIIKYYVNRAILTGFFPNDPTKNPYSLIKIKRSNKTTRSYLSIDEIAKIKNAELPANMELFRDAFLFLCYTGLRISDFMRWFQIFL